MNTSIKLEESPVGNHVGNLISSLGIFNFSENDFVEYYKRKVSVSCDDLTQDFDEKLEVLSLQQHKKKKCPKQSCLQDQLYDDCSVLPQQAQTPNTPIPSSEETNSTFHEEHNLRKKGIFKKEIQRWSNKFIRKEKTLLVRSAGCLS